MPDASPIDSTASDLIAVAAARTTWRDALRMLGLAPTDDNVEGFRRRAALLGISVAHLRSHRPTELLTTAELEAATSGAASYGEVLARLGLRPGGKSYAWLELTCAQRGVVLPAKRAPARCGVDFTSADWTLTGLRGRDGPVDCLVRAAR